MDEDETDFMPRQTDVNNTVLPSRKVKMLEPVPDFLKKNLEDEAFKLNFKAAKFESQVPESIIKERDIESLTAGEVDSEDSCCFPLLEHHSKRYKMAKERLDAYIEDHSEIYQLRYTLSNKRMAGYKFNY